MITEFKIFENNRFTELDCKKYVIWQGKRILMILKFYLATEYQVGFIKIYTYDVNGLKRVRKMANKTDQRMVIYNDKDKIKRHIVFEDDDLQVCIDKIAFIADVKKYNL